MKIGEGWKCAEDVEKFIERNSVFAGSTHMNLNLLAMDRMPLRCEKDFLIAYNVCPPLKSIIGKRAKAFNSGKKEIMRRSTEKKATGATAGMIRDLLAKPNVLQTWKQYNTQKDVYIDIFGYCPVLKIRPAGMPDTISSIWNIPPWLFDIDYTRKLWRQNDVNEIYKSYWILWEGERVELKREDLFFVFDDGIGTECDTNLTIPDSRLVGMDDVISNIVAAYKARNTLITKRGAIGILSNESKDGDAGNVPLNPKKKEELQAEFKKYGLIGQAYQVIISDANLKWQQMGFATKDLMLFEEVEDDKNRLCEAYGYPSGMMGQTKQSTHNNKQMDRRDFIENTIVPECESRDEQFIRGLTDDPDLILVTDFSKLTILQEDKKAAADAMNAMSAGCEKAYLKGVMTKNEWRKRIDLEPVTDDDTFEEYYDAEAAADAASQRTININAARQPANGGQQNAA